MKYKNTYCLGWAFQQLWSYLKIFTFPGGGVDPLEPIIKLDLYLVISNINGG